MQGQTSVLLYLPPYPFENQGQLTAGFREHAVVLGYVEPLNLVTRRLPLSKIPVETTILTDQLGRLSDDPFKAVTFLYRLIVDRSCEVFVPGVLDLRKSSSTYEENLGLIRILVGLKAEIHSNKIKTGLWTARQMGKQVGRAPLPEDVREYILAEYDRCQEVRPLVRRLKSEGIEISRSALDRLIKTRAKGGAE